MSRPSCRGVLDGGVGRCSGVCGDVDHPTPAPTTELHRAGRECEQRVVATPADVLARVEVRPALTDQDLAGVDLLAAEPLHTQALRVGVAPVPAGRRTLLVCHLGWPTSRSRCR